MKQYVPCRLCAHSFIPSAFVFVRQQILTLLLYPPFGTICLCFKYERFYVSYLYTYYVVPSESNLKHLNIGKYFTRNVKTLIVT